VAFQVLPFAVPLCILAVGIIKYFYKYTKNPAIEIAGFI
jgi:hypothetical protein